MDAIHHSQKEELKRRIDEYWSKHSDEKNALVAERTNLEKKILSLQAEITYLPESQKKENIQEHINALHAKKSSLGLFKKKEKIIIQEKIANAFLELKELNDKISLAREDIEKKIEPLRKRVNEINTELTKAR